MDVTLVPLSSVDFATAANAFNAGFEGYITGSPQLDAAAFAEFAYLNLVDLNASVLVLDGEHPIAIGIVSRFGARTRVAAMAVIARAQRSGVGTRVMNYIIDAARARGDRELVLEVIEQNDRAVQLYRKLSFKTVRRLVGFKADHPPAHGVDGLHDEETAGLLRVLADLESLDLPWQMALPNLAVPVPRRRIHRYRGAFAAISSPDASPVRIQTLVAASGLEYPLELEKVLKRLVSRYKDREWSAIPVFPEEYAPVFASAGFERIELSQWQMALPLA